MGDLEHDVVAPEDTAEGEIERGNPCKGEVALKPGYQITARMQSPISIASKDVHICSNSSRVRRHGGSGGSRGTQRRR
jgi:hypothetical protein